MKRSLCINPLIALFLVQILCVNNEKVVSSLPGDAKTLVAESGYRIRPLSSLFWPPPLCAVGYVSKMAIVK